MLVVLYLCVGLVVVGKQDREEINECNGFEVIIVLLLWPFYLVVRGVEWVGERIKDYLVNG